MLHITRTQRRASNRARARRELARILQALDAGAYGPAPSYQPPSMLRGATLLDTPMHHSDDTISDDMLHSSIDKRI